MGLLVNTFAMFLFTLFVVSAVPKILHLSSFRELVVAYGVLPDSLAKIYGVILPFLELVGAGLLLFERTISYGASILLGLLLSFAYAVFRVLRSKKTITCGCYGKFIDAKADAFTMGKIVLLIFASLFTLVTSYHYSVQPDILSLFSGSFTTGCLLTIQWVWSNYKKTITQLKNYN